MICEHQKVVWNGDRAVSRERKTGEIRIGAVGALLDRSVQRHGQHGFLGFVIRAKPFGRGGVGFRGFRIFRRFLGATGHHGGKNHNGTSASAYGARDRHAPDRSLLGQGLLVYGHRMTHG